MKRLFVLVVFISLVFPGLGLAQEVSSPEGVQSNLNLIWIVFSSALVLLIQPGFALLAAGLAREKNVINLFIKSLLGMAIALIGYWAVGFGLMFGESGTGFFGTSSFFLKDVAFVKSPSLYSLWLFQGLLATIPITICSAAMSERVKLWGYLAGSAIMAGFLYPVFGSWVWGGLYRGSGWLEKLGFSDFAGSTLIHSLGGWAALAGVMVVGPRLGKYNRDGKPNVIPGHNLLLAASGVFLLWFCWIGLNGGNTGLGNHTVALIAVNTILAGASGGITAMVASLVTCKKPDVVFTLNGILAGLVAISAGCADAVPSEGVVIGAISGILVVISILFFEKIKIDDPVGAISVHGVCGAWGTLAMGFLLREEPLILKPILIQLLGIGVCFGWSFSGSYLAFKFIHKTIGLRVSPQEESQGLDYTEHGTQAYTEFRLPIS